MAWEIERKFLVSADVFEHLSDGIVCRQGYLPTAGNNVVRVRIAGDRAFLTVKGSDKGAGRLEFEYPVPLSDAREILIELCEKPIIEKTRYLVDFKGHTWEIDVFHSDNEGLVIAEVELASTDEAVELPCWVGREVTEDHRYSNSNLVKNPFLRWSRSDSGPEGVEADDSL